jgi:hypothetical protein
MGRSALPSTDRSTVWLSHLIEATEAVAQSVEPCDAAIVKAFSHRLGTNVRRACPETEVRQSTFRAG